MTTRRKLLVALGTGTLAAAFSSLAQQQGKVWRIGYLSPRAGIKSAEEAFLQGLRSLGYVDGQNIVIEWRFANGNADRLPGLAAELVRLNVDCILAGGANSALAAKRATSTIPIVMGNTDDDPVLLGLVASLARPGGNVTGFINMGAKLAGKRLELLKETLPRASRVAMLWDPNSRPAAGHVRETKSAAHALGVTLQSLEVRKPDDSEHAFLVAGEMRAEALIVVATGSVNVDPARVVNLALKARLPAIYTLSRYVLDYGGLMSYAEEAYVTWRNAASYVDRILKGARPADLPVVQPTKFELLINLKTAKQIGVTIPESVLQRADGVIE
jgi:putative tryptophan/tyrosine transport system substrate-binding protein